MDGPVLPNYTMNFLNECPWLHMRVATVGLLGGSNCYQPFDFKNACKTCGAGATPIVPIIADLNKMGKKKLDQTAHDGFTIISQDLSQQLSQTDLTGYSIEAVRHKTQSAQISTRFAWLHVSNVWPKLDERSVLQLEDLCQQCGRAGHFDTYSRLTKLWYDHAPENANDFNQTWEYFGVWRAPGKSAPNVGGAQWIIVSQRARRFFLEHAVKYLQFDPIFFVSKK